MRLHRSLNDPQSFLLRRVLCRGGVLHLRGGGIIAELFRGLLRGALCAAGSAHQPNTAEAKAQAADLDPVELYEARQSIRPEYEATANEKLEQVFDSKYSPLRWMDAKQAQTRLTNDSAEEYAVRQLAKQWHKSMSQPNRKRRPGQER